LETLSLFSKALELAFSFSCFRQ